MTDSARSALALHLKARENIAGLLAPFTLAQLNTVPAGFNNNLIWNAGHVIATCELLTYGLAGKPTPSDRAFIDRYRKGTRPEAPAGQAEADRIVAGLNGGHRQLAEAIENEDWGGFKRYATSFGVTVGTLGEALSFNNLHEAMHLGTMIALRKLV